MSHKQGNYVLVELLQCELTKKELIIKDSVIDLLKFNISLKDSIIRKEEERYNNCSNINKNSSLVIDNQNIIIDELKKQIRKEKRNKIIAIVSGGLLTILSLLAF